MIKNQNFLIRKIRFNKINDLFFGDYGFHALSSFNTVINLAMVLRNSLILPGLSILPPAESIDFISINSFRYLTRKSLEILRN